MFPNYLPNIPPVLFHLKTNKLLNEAEKRLQMRGGRGVCQWLRLKQRVWSWNGPYQQLLSYRHILREIIKCKQEMIWTSWEEAVEVDSDRNSWRCVCFVQFHQPTTNHCFLVKPLWLVILTDCNLRILANQKISRLIVPAGWNWSTSQVLGLLFGSWSL